MQELFEIIDQIFGFKQPNPLLPEIVYAIFLSFGLNLLIATVYRTTYKGSDLSQDYVHTLMILGTVVSVVVMVVRNDPGGNDPTGAKSQATAFGIFAAFSLIRFRFALTTARDIAFVFVAMAAGLGVGARQYSLATATTVIICAIIYVFSRQDAFAPPRASHRLRVRVTNDVDYDTAFKDCFEKFLHDHDLVSVESIQAGMMTELRFVVHLKETAHPGEFVAAIQQVNGNNRVLLTTTTPNRALAVD
jgi:hypothetical protein